MRRCKGPREAEPRAAGQRLLRLDQIPGRSLRRPDENHDKGRRNS